MFGNKMIAVVAGMVAAVLVVVIFDGLNHLVYPPPSGFNFEDKIALKTYIFAAPLVAQIIFLLGAFLLHWQEDLLLLK